MVPKIERPHAQKKVRNRRELLMWLTKNKPAVIKQNLKTENDKMELQKYTL